MRFQQLKSLLVLVDCGFNVSAAARSMHLSQSVVSTHLKQLEEELGAAIVARCGKRLIGPTPIGQDTIALARAILSQVSQLRRVRDDHYSQSTGNLTIAVTFAQSHHVLPRILKRFMREFPAVSVSVRQGGPREIVKLVQLGEADLCISTEVINDYPELTMLLCYQWNRGVVVPEGHPLAKGTRLTLERIARYRIITYDATVDTNLKIRRAFHEKGLLPNIAVTAVDAYTIKTYVGLGLGVGIVANIAFDARADRGLKLIDASHLFPASDFGIGVRRSNYLRGFAYRFIELYAPQWTRDRVNRALVPVESSPPEHSASARRR
ncbi:MAG: LysR substrate-binding domain-containing protein [Pseudomonadota bacterium]|nr:LysR substrate-binding domain-containing protein [Pseudomonadota bacterium]